MIAAMVALACVFQDAQLETHPTPEQAAAWVVADLASLPQSEREHQFYVWVPGWGDASWHHVAASAMNHAVSRSKVIQRPIVLASGWVQRWDLRLLLPEEADRRLIGPMLDDLCLSDPYFYDRDTGSLHFTVRNAAFGLDFVVPNQPLRVMRCDQFVRMTLSSIEGGKYLELRGLTSFPSNLNRSQEAEILARFAIFEQTSENVDGDRRVGMFASDVTDKARSVVAISGNSFNVAWLTEDIFDEDVSADTHAIYNLLENDFRGKEIIWQLPNGLHGFMITDQSGTVLREAPPQLVTDHLVPRPHTARLQGGAISCIRCHASEAGLRSCRNDVASLLSGPLRVLGDTNLGLTQDAVDAIATRYSGRVFETALRRGREDYEAAVDQLTAGDLTVQELGDLTADVYGQLVYPRVTTEIALKELGVEMPEPFASPKAVFRELVQVPVSGTQAILEDPSVAALYEDIPIKRSDFERIYGALLIRSNVWRMQ